MTYHVVILSEDAVFSRMLELELLHCGLRVLSLQNVDSYFETEMMLLDLDSISTPIKGSYQSAIGFTRSSALTANDMRRNCSMILHRPFEVARLRQEILSVICAEGGDRPLAMRDPFMSASANSAVIELQETVLHYNGKTCTLTPKECALMKCFLEERGAVVTKERLDEVLGESSANKTEVYVCYLRRKLETLCDRRMIETVRGKGYLLKE